MGLTDLGHRAYFAPRFPQGAYRAPAASPPRHRGGRFCFPILPSETAPPCRLANQPRPYLRRDSLVNPTIVLSMLSTRCPGDWPNRPSSGLAPPGLSAAAGPEFCDFSFHLRQVLSVLFVTCGANSAIRRGSSHLHRSAAFSSPPSTHRALLSGPDFLGRRLRNPDAPHRLMTPFGRPGRCRPRVLWLL
jgi:hypothetical protein